MKRLYAVMLVNALVIAGVILMTVWGISPFSDDFTFRVIGTCITLVLYLSFTTIFRMDFATLESKTVGYAILGFASALELFALLALWEIWTPDKLFLQFIATFGILIALGFYLLSLREDILREKRQKDGGFLD